MRVLFLTTGYPHSASVLSGIFHRTSALELVNQGVEVEVIAPVPWSPKPIAYLQSEWQIYHQIPKRYLSDGNIVVHRPRYLQIPGLSDWLFLPRQFALAVQSCRMKKPDVIHSHFSYPCGMASIFLSDYWKIPIVLTLHGSDVNLFPFRNHWCKEQFKKAVRGQDQVIAVSRVLAVITLDLTGVNPEVVPIGVDSSRFANIRSKSQARATLNLPPDKFVVLFVGTFKPGKGVRELLAALMLLNVDRIVAVFCGDGPLLYTVKEHRVIVPGLVQPENIPTYLAAADMLVLPSHHEGLPTILVEAGFAGLPVIASDVGGIPELIGSERGYLIPPKSVEAIASAIELVIADYPAALIKAQNLKKHVRAEYDVTQCTHRLVGIYEEVQKKYGYS